MRSTSIAVLSSGCCMLPWAQWLKDALPGRDVDMNDMGRRHVSNFDSFCKETAVYLARQGGFRVVTFDTWSHFKMATLFRSDVIHVYPVVLTDTWSNLRNAVLVGVVLCELGLGIQYIGCFPNLSCNFSGLVWSWFEQCPSRGDLAGSSMELSQPTFSFVRQW